MYIFDTLKKGFALLLLALISSNVFAQCPNAIIEKKRKVFYKDVLNEYVQKSIKGGQYTVNIDNGTLSLIDNKKYIKPSKLGAITIKITEVQAGAKFEYYDYFICEALPNPTLSFVANTNDTINVANFIASKSFKNITSIMAKSVVPDITVKATIEHFTVTIIGKKNKITTFEVKDNNNLPSILQVSSGDKVMFTNIKIKMEGEQESRLLENKVIEITE